MAHLMNLFFYTNWYTTETNSTYDMTWHDMAIQKLSQFKHTYIDIYIVFHQLSELCYYAYTLLFKYPFYIDNSIFNVVSL